MQRPLVSFPLPAGLLGKLKSAGFGVCDDLRGLGVVELSKELNIAHSEAAEILRVVSVSCQASSTATSKGSKSTAISSTSNGKSCDSIEGRSALDLLRAEQLQSYIVTFSAQVDGMLGGGIPLGKITEICGAPGVGKTQFSMQLAVDVRIPELFGGVEGEAVFIDTEGSFIVERVVDIAQSTIQHLKSVAKTSNDEGMVESSNRFTLESILAGIHYFRCHDYLELVSAINLLPEFFSAHPKIHLVVVDSIASPFRHGFEDMGLRNRLLSGISQNLIKLATQSNIAVVLTNQMTTRVNREGNGSTQLVPALGESWGHACTNRVVLHWSGAERQAMLYKSPCLKETTVPYQVTAEGIRDIINPSPGHSQENTTSEPPLSQLVSLTSSQMDELEMSPGYDNDTDDKQVAGVTEYGQDCDSYDLQGFKPASRQTKKQDCFESEGTTTAHSMHGASSGRIHYDRDMTSEGDTCCSEKGGHVWRGTRKRPHPDL